MTFTSFCLSPHRLNIELGRWSCTPTEQRLCTCGTGVQNENICYCVLLTPESRVKLDCNLNDLSAVFISTDKSLSYAATRLKMLLLFCFHFIYFINVLTEYYCTWNILWT